MEDMSDATGGHSLKSPVLPPDAPEDLVKNTILVDNHDDIYVYQREKRRNEFYVMVQKLVGAAISYKTMNFNVWLLNFTGLQYNFFKAVEVQTVLGPHA